MKQFAGTLIIKDGKVLLVQESHTSAKGLWSLPIGSVEKDETQAEGAIRETKEETGYEVKLGNKHTLLMSGKKLKSLCRFNKKQVTLTIFEAEIVSGDLLHGNDLLDAKWHLIEELDHLELRGDWVRDFTKK